MRNTINTNTIHFTNLWILFFMQIIIVFLDLTKKHMKSV
jgi:hypothetical protein